MKKLILFVLFTTLTTSRNKKESLKKESSTQKVGKTHEQSLAEMFPRLKVQIKTSRYFTV